MKHLVVLTGAGISEESGLATFRGAGGLWEGKDVMEVASIHAWRTNPGQVLEFYNQRRRDLKTVAPNQAHQLLVRLEEHFRVSIITQNVDDLHERAGSSSVLHLHGELLKVRSTMNKHQVQKWHQDLNLGDFGLDGYQLRPDIVWFGEEVPQMENAIDLTLTADLFLVVGTSLQVYPAASLLDFVPHHAEKYLIDPDHVALHEKQSLHHIKERATSGLEVFYKQVAEG